MCDIPTQAVVSPQSDIWEKRGYVQSHHISGMSTSYIKLAEVLGHVYKLSQPLC